VKQGALVLLLCLPVCLGNPASAAAPAPPWREAATPERWPSRPLLAQRRRCYPSHCGCRGAQKTWCTRDCRRDRTCWCVRGRYVCSLYVSGGRSTLHEL